MDTFSHYTGTSANLVDFLAVPAQPGEEYGQRINLYEVQMEPGLLLKVTHTPNDGGDEDVSVEMLHQGRRVLSQSLSCVRIIVDRQNSETFLVLCEGSTNLHIHKNPWRLYVNHSTYYANTSNY